MNKLVGIIPAAGSATRMFPYNGDKELLPAGIQKIPIDGKVEERPKVVSQYIIEAMAEAEVNQIIMVTHPYKHKLMSLHLDGSLNGVNISYIVQNTISMVHSIDLAYEWVRSSTVVMGMPDTIPLPVDCVRQLIQQHRNSGVDLSLGLFPTDKSYKFGMIKTDKDSNIIYHEDKPARTDASYMWGIAVWEPCFMQILHEHVQKAIPSDREMVLGDIFNVMLSRRKKCKAYPITNGKYYDIGTYDDYKKAVLEL